MRLMFAAAVMEGYTGLKDIKIAFRFLGWGRGCRTKGIIMYII